MPELHTDDAARDRAVRARRAPRDNDLAALTERVTRAEHANDLATQGQVDVPDAAPGSHKGRLTVRDRAHRAIVYDLERHAARGQGFRADRALMASAAAAMRELLGLGTDEALLPKDRTPPVSRAKGAAT